MGFLDTDFGKMVIFVLLAIFLLAVAGWITKPEKSLSSPRRTEPDSTLNYGEETTY